MSALRSSARHSGCSPLARRCKSVPRIRGLARMDHTVYITRYSFRLIPCPGHIAVVPRPGRRIVEPSRLQHGVDVVDETGSWRAKAVGEVVPLSARPLRWGRIDDRVLGHLRPRAARHRVWADRQVDRSTRLVDRVAQRRPVLKLLRRLDRHAPWVIRAVLPVAETAKVDLEREGVGVQLVAPQRASVGPIAASVPAQVSIPAKLETPSVKLVAQRAQAARESVLRGDQPIRHRVAESNRTGI
eukprot:scaffold806_cov115-Isochrysis_galbana.AAC.2